VLTAAGAWRRGAVPAGNRSSRGGEGPLTPATVEAEAEPSQSTVQVVPARRSAWRSP
jgi:hypothetical protein